MGVAFGPGNFSWEVGNYADGMLPFLLLGWSSKASSLLWPSSFKTSADHCSDLANVRGYNYRYYLQTGVKFTI